mmetsp:Transcript_30640/g.66880  ORF Transcript_30640/g.66880 Transcript_30640/m.66880 type:complete len:229 (+) Transcript_30640:346-1032(+)
MRTSINLSSAFSLTMASLISFRGLVSPMLSPRSITCCLTFSSSSFRWASSLVSSATFSVLLLYLSWIKAMFSRQVRYSRVRCSSCVLTNFSRESIFSSAVATSASTLSSCALLSGSALMMVSWWLCVLSRCARQSLPSGSTVTRSCGPTRSSSIFHSAASTCECRGLVSSSSFASFVSLVVNSLLPSMYASSSSSSGSCIMLPMPCWSSCMSTSAASSTSASSAYPSG